MKKLATVLSAAAISLSLIVCGGLFNRQVLAAEAFPSIELSARVGTAGASKEQTKSEVSYEEAKQAILKLVDVAYTGLTPAEAPMYFLADNEGEYVALVLENADGESYIKFVGSSEIDEESGILTVTDSDTGYSFGFTAEKQDDGSFFLDCGNVGEAYLEADEPGDVVDKIVNAFLTMEDATESFMDAMAELSFMESLDFAYTGSTALEAPMFFLAGGDGEFAALILVSANGKEFISFVGTAEFDEKSGITTVTDSEKGYKFGFIAEEQEDGSFFLDCGDLGECYLEEDEIENVVYYIDTVYLEMEDVTDKFMAEIAKKK